MGGAMSELTETPPGHRSGFVAVIGRPNVGKSTLFNRLLGQKIAITSPKPQTTRDQIMGILTEEGYQIIFLDTPGIHKPEHSLGEYMMEVVDDTLADADLVLWLVDVHVAPKPEEVELAATLQKRHAAGKLPPVALGLNKLDDAPADPVALAARLDEYRSLLGWQTPPSGGVQPAVAFSARTGRNVEALVNLLVELLPEGPQYYPPDQVTDVQVRFLVGELVREKALMLLQQEVPHSIAVAVDEFTARSDDLTYISAVIYVERPSQKGIVLGQGGAMIRKIGRAARPEIEELVGTRVYLELWVKVWEKWRRREGMLRRLGYAV